MAVDSVAKAQAAGGVYPVRKRGEAPPGNESTGPSVKEAVDAGAAGKAVDNKRKGPVETGMTGKGGKINALA